jgi:hypothetical protein
MRKPSTSYLLLAKGSILSIKPSERKTKKENKVEDEDEN